MSATLSAKPLVAAVGAITCTLLIGACGTATVEDSAPSSTQEQTCKHVDPTVLQSVMYDYEPADRIEELVEHKSPFIVQGRVKGFIAGPETPDPYVMMRVAISEQFTEDRALLESGGEVLIAIPQGAVDSKTGKPVQTIDVFEKNVPPGTNVIAFARPAREDIAKALISQLPDGAQLAATSVQGLYIDDCGKLIGGLDQLVPDGEFAELRTFDQLQDEIQRLAPSLSSLQTSRVDGSGSLTP